MQIHWGQRSTSSSKWETFSNKTSSYYRSFPSSTHACHTHPHFTPYTTPLIHVCPTHPSLHSLDHTPHPRVPWTHSSPLTPTPPHTISAPLTPSHSHPLNPSQVLRVMEKIWLRAGLDLKMIHAVPHLLWTHSSPPHSYNSSHHIHIPHTLTGTTITLFIPHPFTPSPIHVLPSYPIHSLTPHSLPYSFPHSLTPSLPHPFTPSPIHSLTPRSLPSLFIPSLLFPFSPSPLHSLTPSPLPSPPPPPGILRPA